MTAIVDVHADDRGAAVSCTGAGEFFIRESVALQIKARVGFLGDSLKVAADTVMPSGLASALRMRRKSAPHARQN